MVIFFSRFISVFEAEYDDMLSQDISLSAFFLRHSICSPVKYNLREINKIFKLVININ